MPEIVPLLILEGYSAAAAAAVYSGLQAAAFAAASAAASAAVAQRQKISAERRARNEFNSNLRDQMVTLKGGVNPRPIVYGRTAVGGQLLYAETTGAKKEHLLMVVGLAHGEVDAIEDIYFNEVKLSIDGANQVTNAPYAIPGGVNIVTAQYTVPSAAPYTVTLPVTPPNGITSIQDGFYGWQGGDNGAPPQLVSPTDWTLSGAVITFDAKYAGHPVQVAYDTPFGAQSYAAIWRYTGAAAQDISGLMASLNAPSWTANDKCAGFALLVIRLTYAENVWPMGIPNIKAVVRGRKLYDPRSGLTVYSNNAALAARDYLTLTNGVGASTAKIDDTALIAAANICDEQVQLFTVADTAADRVSGDKRFQYRYLVNGALSTGDDRRSNLQELERTLAGSITYSAGKWRIRAGAVAISPPTQTLDESKLADGGAIQIVPYASRRDLINAAKGTYINAEQGFIEDQFPEWTSAGFVTEDGGAKLFTTIPFRMVTDSARAQRLAKIAVYRAREALTLTCTCNLATYAWQVGDEVSVTLTRYGFSAKRFRVVERGFSADGGLRYVLREEPSGIYDWNLGEASILTGAGNTTLPNPLSVGVPTITGITSAQWLRKSADGSFVPRIRVAVTPPADQYVQSGGKLQLAFKAGDWTQDWALVETDGNAAVIWIDPAVDGQNYLIRVRAKNQVGYVSAWTVPQIHTCIGRADVANLCLNSDFTQDIGNSTGDYPDARALRFWQGFAGGITARIGRNYAGGTAWNIGQGGAWCYESGRTVGAYTAVRQYIPIQPSVAYEVSAAFNMHRALGVLEMHYCDGAKTRIASYYDTVDPGNGIVGDAFNTSTHPRLWLTATAPAGASYLEVALVKGTTNLGSADSYAFWSKVMVCVAPSGVTRGTATPWQDDAIAYPRGVVYSALTAASHPSESGLSSYGSPGDYYWDFYPAGGFNLQVTLDVTAGDVLQFEVLAFGNVNLGGGPYYWTARIITDALYTSSGKALMRFPSQALSTGHVDVIDVPWVSVYASDLVTLTRTRTWVAPSTGTITVKALAGSHYTPASGQITGQLRVNKLRQ